MIDEIRRIDGPGFIEIHLNRPGKKNALTLAMYREMTAILAEASRCDAVRVVLIAAEGDAFSAGNDLNDFLHADPGDPTVVDFVRAVTRFDKPLVGAVQGLAVGIGTTMLFHFDLVYASPEAQFIMPFVNLGLVPEAGSSLAAPLVLGRAKAAKMLMLGEPMSASEGEAAGFVSEIVAADRLLDHARAKVAILLAKPPRALAATRALLHDDPEPMADRVEREMVLFLRALQSGEAAEALAAQLAKRKPG